MLKSEYAQLSKNFDTRTGDFLACKCCGKIIINTDVIDHYSAMEEFKKWYARSMPVLSGCRCDKHNKEEGGATSSQHLLGLASDVDLPAEFKSFSLKRKREFMLNIRKKWFEICDKRKIAGGSGFYNGFFHLDSRKEKRSTWDFSNYF